MPRQGLISARAPWRVLTLLIVLCPLLLPSAAMAARISKTYTGEDIPVRLSLGAGFIFENSDSLFVNGRRLQAGSDYALDPGAINLSKLALGAGDTLKIIYHLVPEWVMRSYGRTPAVVSSRDGPTGRVRPSLPKASSAGFGSDITFSGAKSFRFSARSAGSSEFSQSLDMIVSGELKPGLTLRGAVSDRGYDPAYGTANSRLSELDKISLELSSSRLVARVGEIDLVGPKGSRSASRPKRLSGASLAIDYPRWHTEGAVARPKGRFATVRLAGRDGLQGPYQIGAGDLAEAVVPGSETIWLDGRRLERGANKDYIMDYPAGRVTFNVNHPIDSRSRIEVDYELLSTNYRGEFISGGGGGSLTDSNFFADVSWLREGDDREELQTGDLTAFDLAILDAVGDSVSAAVRSGVVGDTAGRYVLDEVYFPDSVYRFVGESNGEYEVGFSYVGTGAGDYRYLGDERYEYVGVGGGEYLPVITLPAPERTDYYTGRIGFKNDVVGTITGEVRQTVYDRNLFSDLDDGDNTGDYYRLTGHKEWGGDGGRSVIDFSSRFRDVEFRSRERLYEADLERRFLLDDSIDTVADQSLHEIRADLRMGERFVLSPRLARLEYRDTFESLTGGADARFESGDRLSAAAGFDIIDASRSGGGDGDGRLARTEMQYELTKTWQGSVKYDFDSRKNRYFGDGRGTRFNRVGLSVFSRAERLAYEYYHEDTLVGGWTESLERNRLSLSSRRRLGALSYALTLTHQWLDQPLSSERNFLGRLSGQYNDVKRRMQVGAAYSISTESRNARGITYLKVDPGLGDYILEDGEYIPDADGDYLQLEELLSDREKVRRAEKSFNFSRDWQTVLVKFNSAIEEELLDEGERSWLWVIPFLSDRDQPYLYYLRRYDADIRLVAMRGFHVINITGQENLQQRLISGASRRSVNRQVSMSLKEAAGNTFFEQRGELFRQDRDEYYSGGGDIEGYRAVLTVRQQWKSAEIGLGGAYRRAEDENSAISDIYSVTGSAILRVISRGELRSALELYRQDLSGVVGTPSYTLTDNKSGEEGAIWSLNLNYGIKGGLRLNFNLSGRHADNRTARITGRGEVVAAF